MPSVAGGTVRQTGGRVGISPVSSCKHPITDPTVRANSNLVLNSVRIECRTTVFWDTFESRFQRSAAEAISLFLDRDCGCHARGQRVAMLQGV
jgi:hypothetical protein